LSQHISNSIDFYNAQIEKHNKNGKLSQKEAADIININPAKIKWTSSLLPYFCKAKKGMFSANKIAPSVYRPFTKMFLYYDRQFNHRYKEKIYPTAGHQNLSIVTHGLGGKKFFSCFITSSIIDLNALEAGCQCFPLYHYEKATPATQKQGSLLDLDKPAVGDEEYIRKEAITDDALAQFQGNYDDSTINKTDIFYYVYGILHSPKYRESFAADLKKMLPRVPMAPDFWAFSTAGKELAHWHLNYESVEPWPVTEECKEQGTRDDFAYYHVEKMRFPKKTEKGTIIYNPFITFKDIPLEAYDYVVNGKSAIEWIMERYAITIDKDSGIKNDPNDWCKEHDDPRYIYNLVKRIIRVSMETNRIVASLPDFEEPS
jgi:predicted helicase